MAFTERAGTLGHLGFLVVGVVAGIVVGRIVSSSVTSQIANFGDCSFGGIAPPAVCVTGAWQKFEVDITSEWARGLCPQGANRST